MQKSKGKTKTRPKKKSLANTKAAWSDMSTKRQVFLDIMNNIAAHPAQYFDNDKARQEFARKMDIPKDVRIIVVPDGDSTMKGGGSVVIEAPEQGATLDDNQKLDRFLCTYPIHW